MVCLEKRIPEGIPELEELLPVYLSDEASCFFLCIVQDSQDQPFVGKEQAAEDIKRRMGDLVRFTDFLCCMGMQEIGFQHSQDKAQAVGRIGDQHLGHGDVRRRYILPAGHAGSTLLACDSLK